MTDVRVRTIVIALASYDHEVNDEMGDTWCRFCDQSGPDLQYTPPTHLDICPVLLARQVMVDRKWPVKVDS